MERFLKQKMDYIDFCIDTDGEPLYKILMTDSSSCACVDVARPEPPTIYCDFPIGRDTTGNFSLSYKGIAIRSDCNRYTAFRKLRGEPTVSLFDVTGLTLPGCDCFVYRVPVTAKDVHPGDLLLISDCPFQVLYVEDITEIEHGRVVGVTSSGERITYQTPIRLGEFATRGRFIRIISVLDALGQKATEINENHIALIAALLCCRTSSGDLGRDLLASGIATNALNAMDKLGPEYSLPLLPLLLALQQCQCLESFVLTRALEGRIDEKYLP